MSLVHFSELRNVDMIPPLILRNVRLSRIANDDEVPCNAHDLMQSMGQVYRVMHVEAITSNGDMVCTITLVPCDVPDVIVVQKPDRRVEFASEN